jgi:hypothetical protein
MPEHFRRDSDPFDQVDKYGTRKAAFTKEAVYEPPGQQKGEQPAELAAKSTPMRQVRGKTADKEESNYVSLSELNPGERSPTEYGTHKLKFSSVKLTHDELMKRLATAVDDFAENPAMLTKGGPWSPGQEKDKRYGEIAKQQGAPVDGPVTERQRAMIYSAHDGEALAEGRQAYGTQVTLMKHVPLPTDRDSVAKMLERSGGRLPEQMDPGPGGKIDYTQSKRGQADPHAVDPDAYFVDLTKEDTAHFREMTRSLGAYKPTTPGMREILQKYGQPGPAERVSLSEVEGVLNTKHVSPEHEKLLEKEASYLERREKGISVSQMPEKGHYQQRGVVTEVDEVNGTMYMDIGRKHEVAVPISALDKVPKAHTEVSLDVHDGRGTATPIQAHDRGRGLDLQ